MKEILVIDDDMYISGMLEEFLQQEGYRVKCAYSGTEAIMILKEEKPDIILLDLMLPGLSGEELLPDIKDIPVIVMSAKTDVGSRVHMLTEGAVDYVTKPFHMKELSARIAIHLRLTENREKKAVLRAGDIAIDTDACTVEVCGNHVRLTRTEYAILKLLMEEQGKVVSRSRILDHISDDTPDCTESSLKTHMSNLRRKLRDAGAEEHIEAVWGIGFRIP